MPLSLLHPQSASPLSLLSKYILTATPHLPSPSTLAHVTGLFLVFGFFLDCYCSLLIGHSASVPQKSVFIKWKCVRLRLKSRLFTISWRLSRILALLFQSALLPVYPFLSCACHTDPLLSLEPTRLLLSRGLCTCFPVCIIQFRHLFRRHLLRALSDHPI